MLTYARPYRVMLIIFLFVVVVDGEVVEEGEGHDIVREEESARAKVAGLGHERDGELLVPDRGHSLSATSAPKEDTDITMKCVNVCVCVNASLA
jgi:hypothetical protein